METTDEIGGGDIINSNLSSRLSPVEGAKDHQPKAQKVATPQPKAKKEKSTSQLKGESLFLANKPDLDSTFQSL